MQCSAMGLIGWGWGGGGRLWLLLQTGTGGHSCHLAATIGKMEEGKEDENEE